MIFRYLCCAANNAEVVRNLREITPAFQVLDIVNLIIDEGGVVDS